ncbi:AsmA family protein [Faunimonas sp. B44]|uniref:AsmA family protein n=1 Tax=Faunimonas sp. B44 TaxID=3461493 RepID=UPI004043F600
MKRIAWGVLALVALLAAAAVLGIAALPRDALKTQVAEQFSAWTGREVSMRGEPEIRFFPEPSVTLTEVTVAGPSGMAGGEILRTEKLTGTIRILPLVLGEIDIKSFTMLRPVVTLVRDETGRRNWAFDTGAAALQLAFAGDVPLGRFELRHGTISYDDRQSGVAEQLDDVGIVLEWPSVRGALTLSGSAVWRGEKVDFGASAKQPFAFANRRATAVEARVDAPSIHGRFDGQLSDIRQPQLAGALELSTPSFRGFAGWVGSAIGPGPNLGAATLAGDAELYQGTLSVSNARLMLDGNRAQGALRVGIAPRPSLAGTLAFPSLDLTPYFQEIGAAMTERQDAWRSVGLDTEWYRALEADIRLSADSVTAGPFAAGATAAAASVRDGRFEVAIAQSAFYGGVLSGTIAVTDDPQDESFGMEAQLRANAFDLGQLVARIAPDATARGRATLSADVSTAGLNAGELVAGLSGMGAASIEAGALPDLGLTALAAALRNGQNLQQAHAATSPFDLLKAAIRFDDGLAAVEGTVTAGPDRAAIEGEIDLASGRLRLEGSMANDAAEAGSRFAVAGTLADPVLRPAATR